MFVKDDLEIWFISDSNNELEILLLQRRGFTWVPILLEKAKGAKIL